MKTFILVSLTALTSLTANAAIVTLDQSQTATPTFSYGTDFHSGFTRMGQSFIPSLNGLDVVELLIADSGAIGSTGLQPFVQIREDDFFGTIIGTSNTLNLPLDFGLWQSPPGSTALFTFDTVVPLLPGETYVIDVNTADGSSFFLAGTGTNPYSGGGAIVNEFVGSTSTTFDFYFREGLSNASAVPEPSSFVLMGIGVGLIGLVRRRKEKSSSVRLKQISL